MSRISLHEKTMSSLKAQLSLVEKQLAASKNIIRIDIPMHLNVGDLLIDWGTEVFLESICRKPRLRLSVLDFQHGVHKIKRDDTLLLHGGGNLGDIYPLHENLRQRVLKDFPNNKVIVCPQTIYFKDAEKQKTVLDAYARHSDCHVFVRDVKSFETLKKHNVNCDLCPDMAHALWRSQNGLQPVYQGEGRLLFFRKDIEANGSQGTLVEGLDWSDLIHKGDKAFAKYVFASIKRCPPHGLRRLLGTLWNRRRARIIKLCINTFSTVEEIQTDRLHGLILGCLLGKKVIYSDNSYGKLSSYCDAWLGDIVSRHKCEMAA